MGFQGLRCLLRISRIWSQVIGKLLDLVYRICSVFYIGSMSIRVKLLFAQEVRYFGGSISWYMKPTGLQALCPLV